MRRCIALAALVGCTCSSGPGPGTSDTRRPDGFGGGGDSPLADLMPWPDSGVGDQTLADKGTGPTLTLSVKGDTSAVTINDGASGQTPTTYTLAITGVDLVTSPLDTSPAKVLDFSSQPLELDMLSTTQLGKVPFSKITSGSYSYARIELDSCIFTIAAKVHLVVSASATITVTAALSDTIIGSKAMKQNEADFTFKVSLVSYTVSGTLPSLSTGSGATLVQQGGKSYLVMALPTPLIVPPPTGASIKATVVFGVYESFRWYDQSGTGHATGVFDVDVWSKSYEQVKSFGATSMSLEVK